MRKAPEWLSQLSVQLCLAHVMISQFVDWSPLSATETDRVLEPTTREILTSAEVGRLTDWATRCLYNDFLKTYISIDFVDYFLYYSFFSNVYLWERGGQRLRSRLRTDSREPDTELEVANRKSMTSQVRHLTNWTTHRWTDWTTHRWTDLTTHFYS